MEELQEASAPGYKVGGVWGRYSALKHSAVCLLENVFLVQFKDIKMLEDT